MRPRTSSPRFRRLRTIRFRSGRCAIRTTNASVSSGAALMLFVSQLIGRPSFWHSLGIPDAAAFSRFVEESVELFGYALMFAWAAPHALRVCRVPRRAAPGHHTFG